jgi:hypothetical protein
MFLPILQGLMKLIYSNIEPLVMNEREIASIVSNVTPKVGNKRQRHYRYVDGTAKKF